VPVCPPQIPHDLTWAQTWSAAVGNQWLPELWQIIILKWFLEI
jgi:hypothetical protein